MTWNLPNILSILRLLAAPGIALLYVVLDRPNADVAALVLFVVAALTDFVDGYLARAWNQTSRFGAMVDPIADKAMVVIALAVIMGLSDMDPWLIPPVAFILFREVFVSGLREYLGAEASTLAVTRLAKWKTLTQMVAITVLLAGFGVLDGGAWSLAPPVMVLGTVLLWIAGILTLITGWDYFQKSLPILRRPE